MIYLILGATHIVFILFMDNTPVSNVGYFVVANIWIARGTMK